MAKVGDVLTVYMPVWAEYTFRVEVTEEMVDEDGEADIDLVIDEAYGNKPSGLCYGCYTGNTGVDWRDRSSINLKLNDVAEVRYVTDEEGNVVWGDPMQKLGW